jgi:hypothetical protein
LFVVANFMDLIVDCFRVAKINARCGHGKFHGDAQVADKIDDDSLDSAGNSGFSISTSVKCPRIRSSK